MAAWRRERKTQDTQRSGIPTQKKLMKCVTKGREEVRGTKGRHGKVTETNYPS